MSTQLKCRNFEVSTYVENFPSPSALHIRSVQDTFTNEDKIMLKST